MSRPLGSTPTPASRGFTATTGRSASERRIGTQCLRLFPRHAPSRHQGAQRRPIETGGRYRRSPSHVPCKSRRPGSRRLRTGHHLANGRVPARLIPGAGQRPPVSMPPFISQCFNSDTRETQHHHHSDALERLPGPHLTRSSRASSLTLTTTVFSQRSPGWFDARPRRPTPEGQRSSISRTAPLPKSSPT
jgi:hypothetical protein